MLNLHLDYYNSSRLVVPDSILDKVEQDKLEHFPVPDVFEPMRQVDAGVNAEIELLDGGFEWIDYVFYVLHQVVRLRALLLESALADPQLLNLVLVVVPQALGRLVDVLDQLSCALSFEVLSMEII